MSKKVVAIDPGLKGAIVVLGKSEFKSYAMPIEDKRVSFNGVMQILMKHKSLPVFLERAMPMAMGAKHAFNYGADFCKLEIAIQILEMPVTYVEPSKWTKVVYQGVSNDLKPKAKSLIAVKRLYPKLVSQIPKTPRAQALHEGVIDALLIAGYGLKLL